MKLTVYPWQDREFVAVSGEATEGNDATEQTRELLQRFGSELRRLGLSLDNTVRTRLWGVDRDSRDQGGLERVKVLSGKARSASSSYISPHHFDSASSKVAIDLLAMRPHQPHAEKFLKEYDPPIIPLRYLTYDSMAVLSGVTAVLPTLADQLDNILTRIETSLSRRRTAHGTMLSTSPSSSTVARSSTTCASSSASAYPVRSPKPNTPSSTATPHPASSSRSKQRPSSPPPNSNPHHKLKGRP